MADTEHISLVELGVGDAPAGLLLSTEAHWNQTEADWRFFLSKGIVFGVRDGNQLIATAALLPYSAGNAWISMVLVTANWQRRGVATKLVDACLNAATKLGLTTWLDATPAPTSMAHSASRRRCNCGGCGWKRREAPVPCNRYRPAASPTSSRAMPGRWGLTAALC